MIWQDSSSELDKIQKAVALLKSGFYMIKYSSNQLNPNHRVVYLSESEFVFQNFLLISLKGFKMERTH